MFEIVTKFTRLSSEWDFFYTAHKSHAVVLSIAEQFIKSPGHREIKVISEEQLKIEISMTFDTVEHFQQFIRNNLELIEQRNQLVEDWCSKTKHTYEWYIKY